MTHQWPVDHDGTTAEDLPYGYSYFPTLFDDKRGYDPLIVGHGIDDNGRETIMIALSPGAYLSATLIGQGEVPGQDPGKSEEVILEALREVRRTAEPTPGGDGAGPPP